jgi:hypothetical protein
MRAIRRRITFALTSTLALSVSLAYCSSNEAAPPAAPIVHDTIVTKPTPTIVISADSLAATATSGAGKITQTVSISAGNSTAVTGLAIADVTVGASQPTNWVTATLSADAAPATLNVSINPAALAAAKYDATIRLTATGAAAKTVRVSLTVKPRPTLVLDRSTISLAADLGTTIASQKIAITSVNGVVDSLTVGKPDCGASPAWVTAALDSAKSPATLNIAVSPSGLTAGAYACSVTVSTTQALVDSASQTVKVSLVLRAVPRLALSADTVKAGAFRLADASPIKVAITNVGTGTISGLALGPISYNPPSSVSWLTATLDSTTAPATLTLQASAKSISAGGFNATVPVTTTTSGVLDSPNSVTVAFQVSPLPSALITVPTQLKYTAKQGVALNATANVIVTHSGDAAIGEISFAPFVFNPPQNEWGVIASVGCTGALFSTPCTSTVKTMTYASAPVGTYTALVIYTSSLTGQSAALSVTVVVTP